MSYIYLYTVPYYTVRISLEEEEEKLQRYTIVVSGSHIPFFHMWKIFDEISDLI